MKFNRIDPFTSDKNKRRGDGIVSSKRIATYNFHSLLFWRPV